MEWIKSMIKSIISDIIQQKPAIKSTIDYDQFLTGEATVIAVEPPKQRPYWFGRVAFRGSYWNARTLFPETLEEGDICEVIGNSNITLIIRPFPR
ncbi:NfeD family protein [Argonema antarcticum]|uniref:NfeD family protein n=1 Tax=Argonema antarcticum TaxID=2942763 RepID=UPI00201265DF|nr:NfeD family protein [Argonema antarcticum]MCL1474149.1 NfeD family protein [Argonema antarcticum A004/B2]